MSMSRLLSLIVSGLYLIVGLFFFGWKGLFVLLICNGFCLACIWFPDEMGNAGVGKIAIGGRIMYPTPRSFVPFVGWAMFALPVFVYIFVKIIYKYVL